MYVLGWGWHALAALLLMSCDASFSLFSKPTVCHAELNAIMNKNSADVKGCTMYVALFPCNECAKLIIQAGRSWAGSICHICIAACPSAAHCRSA